MKINFSNQENIHKWYIPLGLLLINFILKIIFLGSNSIANDEPFSIYHAQMAVGSIIHQLSLGNNPPLFEIILHYWIKCFGISAFSVRFLPFLFSTCTVWFVYKIGIKFFNSKVAIIASLIFAFSNYHIYFSHEARVYSLFALLSTISMYAFLSIIKDSKNKWFFSLLVLSNVLLAYSHFFGFFIPAIQMISCLIIKKVRKNVLKINLLAFLILVVSYLPYLSIITSRFFNTLSTGTWVESAIFSDLYFMLLRFGNKPLPTVVFILILFGGLMKLIYSRFKDVSEYSKIIALWFLFPYLFMFLVSLRYLPHQLPIFFDRYVIFISLGFYLTLSISINYLFASARFGVYLMLIPALLMILSVAPNVDNKRHVEDVINKVKEIKSDKSIVYFCPDWFDLNFVYYYNTRYFSDVNEINIKENIYKDLAKEHIYPISIYFQIDTNLIKKADKILYIDAGADFSSPGNNIYDFLSKRFKKMNKFEYPKIYKVYVFEN